MSKVQTKPETRYVLEERDATGKLTALHVLGHYYDGPSDAALSRFDDVLRERADRYTPDSDRRLTLLIRDRVVLVIGDWQSWCGACGQPADLHERQHTTALGTDLPGCGAVWTHVAGEVHGRAPGDHVANMRPDLVFEPELVDIRKRRRGGAR